MAQKMVLVRDLIAATVFYVLGVLLFPVTLIGYVIWVSKTILTGRGSGVSRTAQGPLSARWFMHQLGTRQDEPSNRLMMVHPAVSPLGVRLVAGPMLLAHRLTGYVPRALRYPFEGDIPKRYEASARVTFFDAAVDRYLAEVSQFVILGAGFEKEDWLSRLVDAGFDPGKPAFFLWEGVMMLLDREAVEATLRKIASCASGVAFDYLTTEVLESQPLYGRAARAGLRAAGEPLKFGIESTPPSSERLAALLRSCGLSLGEQRTLGKETEGKRAWGGFAVAIVRGVPPGERTLGS
jgi:Leucine carboxyl methyltransferase